MTDDAPLLDALRHAMDALRRAEHDRTLAWTWAASGLVDPQASRQARMQAERDVEAARERLRHARDATRARAPDEKAWSGH